MKKTILLCGSVLMLSAATLAFFVNSSKESETSLLMRNVEALARNETPHGAGGMANNKCPIWNITWDGGTKISCSTGGHYKCVDGTCPHGA